MAPKRNATSQPGGTATKRQRRSPENNLPQANDEQESTATGSTVFQVGRRTDEAAAPEIPTSSVRSTASASESTVATEDATTQVVGTETSEAPESTIGLASEPAPYSWAAAKLGQRIEHIVGVWHDEEALNALLKHPKIKERKKAIQNTFAEQNQQYRTKMRNFLDHARKDEDVDTESWITDHRTNPHLVINKVDIPNTTISAATKAQNRERARQQVFCDLLTGLEPPGPNDLPPQPDMRSSLQRDNRYHWMFEDEVSGLDIFVHDDSLGLHTMLEEAQKGLKSKGKGKEKGNGQ